MLQQYRLILTHSTCQQPEATFGFNAVFFSEKNWMRSTTKIANGFSIFQLPVISVMKVNEKEVCEEVSHLKIAREYNLRKYS
ncbi:hypothetical protein LZZ85_02470 [Terrimonas sp. NA20]|uniref:Uncharacterized protein n=1 Tax=Terrimonas ginsenosidimutans TaxID=2908004 RepID=A0ABS9KLC3_9BACT|nr:hypothetical protein [Terrimonas ginsenosidimutans]MCG2613119.1 hypothetical protein [Terrimonas ginsenosidimutans]